MECPKICNMFDWSIWWTLWTLLTSRYLPPIQLDLRKVHVRMTVNSIQLWKFKSLRFFLISSNVAQFIANSLRLPHSFKYQFEKKFIPNFFFLQFILIYTSYLCPYLRILPRNFYAFLSNSFESFEICLNLMETYFTKDFFNGQCEKKANDYSIDVSHCLHDINWNV